MQVIRKEGRETFSRKQHTRVVSSMMRRSVKMMMMMMLLMIQKANIQVFPASNPKLKRETFTHAPQSS